MYKLVNLRTGKFYQATKGFDLVLQDKISAIYLKDDLEEETGDGYKLVPFEDGNEPGDDEDEIDIYDTPMDSAFWQWMTDGKQGGALELLAKYNKAVTE